MTWEEMGRRRRALWLALAGPTASLIRRQIARLIAWDPFSGDLGRYRFAHGRCRSSRIALTNHLIFLNGYRSYLEIGVRRKASMFDEILCPERTGVDPDPAANADFQMTSDAFFAATDARFDIVFIDGNHTGEQVTRDILNALDHLEPGGVILLHDMNPPTAFHARRDYQVNGRFPSWIGTAWRGFAALRRTRCDLEMCVVATDWGVGIVRPGRQALYTGACMDYSDLAADRRRMLNLISVPEFLRRFSTPFAEDARHAPPTSTQPADA